MTEPTLFSDPTPPTTGPSGADPAAKRRSDPRETSAMAGALRSGESGRGDASPQRPRDQRAPSASSSTSPSHEPRRDEPSPQRRLGQQDTPAALSASPAGEFGRGGPSSERPRDHRDTPAAPTASSPTGESGRGGPSSDQLLGLLDGLVVGLDRLGGGRLEECLRLVGRCEARLAAVKADKVAELAQWRGEAHAAAVLRGDLKQSRGAAKRDVAFAERLGDLPGTADALAEGAITPQHARAIADASAHTAIEEAELLDAAGTEPADTFARTVRDHVNEKSAGEDLERRRRRQRARREANIKQESDGMYTLYGTFDPLAGARIETALAATAKNLWRNEDPNNRATPAQRYADALETLITHHSAGAGKAQSTTLVVVADYGLVSDQLADARLIDGTPIAPSELLKVALAADILPALFDTKGQPLWLGHKTRTATVAQRVALAIRDRGCVICGAANSYCQAHHVIHWEDGGPTDIDNLCLLCSDCHHKQIHELGADLTRQPDGTYHLEHPPNWLPNQARDNRKSRTREARTAKARTAKARNGKARNGKAHAGKHGPSGRRNGEAHAGKHGPSGRRNGEAHAGKHGPSGRRNGAATDDANRTANHPLRR